MINTYNLSKISNKILQQEINKVDSENLFENIEYDLTYTEKLSSSKNINLVSLIKNNQNTIKFN